MRLGGRHNYLVKALQVYLSLVRPLRVSWEGNSVAIIYIHRINTKTMKYQIEQGDVFLCKKHLIMDDGEVSYIRNKIYISDMDDCITDEQGTVEHYMNNLPEFFEYFKLLI